MHWHENDMNKKGIGRHIIQCDHALSRYQWSRWDVHVSLSPGSLHAILAAWRSAVCSSLPCGYAQGNLPPRNGNCGPAASV